MSVKGAFVLLLVWHLSLSTVRIKGRNLSKEEDIELEKQLKRINKPAVKTIKTIYGDLYDCVDFYKQPGFDHPALRNQSHNFHPKMKPTTYPKGRKTSNADTPESNIWLNGKGCPSGTVPIRRTTKEQLISSKLTTEIYHSQLHSQGANSQPGIHKAVLRTKYGSPTKYYGAGMWTSVYGLSLHDNSQFTSSEMIIQNGPDCIIVGWTINPGVYKDNLTRSFVYTDTADSHCFNTHCGGFVIASTVYPVDMVLPHLSTPGGPIYDIPYFVYKDAANGNWFLEVGCQNTIVGFWPQKIFSGLADSAVHLEWGGEAYSPPNISSPPMGSGAYNLIGDTRFDGFCCNITVINSDQTVVEPNDTEVYLENGKFYYAEDKGHVTHGHNRLLLFGGGGGID